MGVSIEQIKKIREETGAGILDAKKALESAGGDFEAAVNELRKKGMAKAAKRADRETTEGRVEARSKGTESGLMVEINCETDFVGRNENFVDFTTQITDHFFAVAQEGQTLEDLQDTAMEDGTTPAEGLQNLISATGENMQLRRLERYDLADRPGIIEVYLHPGNRVGVILELNSESESVAAQDEFVTVAHDLALHIAAMAPNHVNRADIPAETLEAEKETYRAQAVAEGKPEAIVERIIDGRLRKYYEGIVLLEQAFVKDDEITVEELLTQASKKLGEKLTVQRFVRYELGEPLD